MPIKVSDELRKALPEPDSKGIIRANVALEVEGDVARILEINDVPVEYAEGDDKEKNDDASPMPASDLPDLTGGGGPPDNYP